MQGTDRSQPTQRQNNAQSECRPHQLDNNHPYAAAGFDKAWLFYDAIFQGELAAYILEVQNDGRLTFADANDLVAKIAGLPVAQIYGRTPHECLPAEIAQPLEAHARQSIQSTRSITYDRSLDLPKGRVAFRTQLMPAKSDAGAVTHIVGLTRDITQEADLLDDARHNATLLQRLGIALPSALYVVNVQTQALHFIGGAVDPAGQEWRRRAEAAGSETVARFFHPDDHAKAEAQWKNLAGLADGEVSTVDYRILAPDGSYHHYGHRETVFSRGADGAVEWVLGLADDVTDRDQAEQEVRDLSKQIITLHFDERRRFAQELHDSTGQYLAAIGMSLDRALSFQANEEVSPILVDAIAEARRSLDAVQRETRVLSFLLHPPELADAGLSRAMGDFARGFGRRAGIDVDLDIADEVDCAGDEVSLTLFRVCQEALTNVYRHAGATRANIAVKSNADNLILVVADNGAGFDAFSQGQATSGVGLASMRDRVERMGGEFSLTSGPRGTTLIATVRRLDGAKP